jgi:hypothetical protein
MTKLLIISGAMSQTQLFILYMAITLTNIPTVNAIGTMAPTEFQGNTIFPLLTLLVAAAAALLATEFNEATALEEPLSLIVASLCDTLDETILALALAELDIMDILESDCDANRSVADWLFEHLGT